MERNVSDDIQTIHRDIDLRASEVEAQNAGRLHCRQGCAGCCIDDITVFEAEAAPIRQAYRELLEHGQPHAEGACAFLDETGTCRIYASRPYVCRTQGLPLRWLDDEEGIERRDICELNDLPVEGATPTLLDLPIEACWTLGPIEERLAKLQWAISGDRTLARVRLRDLFTKR